MAMMWIIQELQAPQAILGKMWSLLLLLIMWPRPFTSRSKRFLYKILYNNTNRLPGARRGCWRWFDGPTVLWQKIQRPNGLMTGEEVKSPTAACKLLIPSLKLPCRLWMDKVLMEERG